MIVDLYDDPRDATDELKVTYVKFSRGTDGVAYKLDELNRKFDNDVKLERFRAQSQLCSEATAIAGALAASIEKPSEGETQKRLFYSFHDGKRNLIDSEQVTGVLDRVRGRVDMENEDTDEFKLTTAHLGVR